MTSIGTRQLHGRLGDTRHAQVRAQRKRSRSMRNSPKSSSRRASRKPRERRAHVECARREGMLVRADARARKTRVLRRHEVSGGGEAEAHEGGGAPRHVGKGQV